MKTFLLIALALPYYYQVLAHMTGFKRIRAWDENPIISGIFAWLAIVITISWFLDFFGWERYSLNWDNLIFLYENSFLEFLLLIAFVSVVPALGIIKDTVARLKQPKNEPPQASPPSPKTIQEATKPQPTLLWSPKQVAPKPPPVKPSWGRSLKTNTPKKGKIRPPEPIVGVIALVLVFSLFGLNEFTKEAPATKPPEEQMPALNPVTPRVQNTQPTVTVQSSPPYSQAFRFEKTAVWSSLGIGGQLFYGICEDTGDNAICIGLVCKSGRIHFMLAGTGGAILQPAQFNIYVDADKYKFEAIPSKTTGLSYEAVSKNPLYPLAIQSIKNSKILELETDTKWFITPLTGSSSAVDELTRRCI